MIRRIFTTLSVLSLALCLGMSGLWIFSYHFCEGIDFNRYVANQDPQNAAGYPIMQDVEGVLLVGKGLVFIHYFYIYGPGAMIPLDPAVTAPHPGWAAVYWEGDRAWMNNSWIWLSPRGFQCNEYRNGGLSEVFAGLPVGFICGILAILPTILFSIMLKRRLKRQPGVCAKCRYDLRATPERCPECGAVPRKIRIAS
ncbi:MAG TPA: hypothetical protein VFE47_25370 [Tepidisphaeraceae bacterium]|jgi:hypothetical protein|nr:hypothetical protein [Tepidisphaeraceae bacterium]